MKNIYKSKKGVIPFGLMLIAFLGMTATESIAQTVINNGKMRFGNGSENSVNATGNLQQPFYYSTQFNSWRPLTFSTQPLSQTIGFGGDGSNEWNTNGTQVTNINLSTQSVDVSDFVYANGTSGAGTGKIVSTGYFSEGGKSFKIENTYEIQNSAFITITTKVTNWGTTPIQNLRYWIGAGDDYVGQTDGPMKEKGNLIDGSFQINSTAAEQAKALRIKTADEGVLFFSTSDRAYNIIGNSYGWNNVVSANPSSGQVSRTHDGSYGMYVRMNDLGQGQSDEFTWFYAAAKLADLDDVVSEVAAAAGQLGNVTCNSAVYEAESSVNGTGYLMVVADGSAAPTANQIKAGAAYGSVTPIYTGSQAMNANVTYEFDITGLQSSTTYKAYFVHENTSAVLSDVVANSIITAGNPEITFTVTNANCVNSGDGALTAAATNGTEPFVFQWTDGPENATYTDIDGGSYEVQVTDANNCQATANGVVEIVDGISPVAAAKDISIYLGANGEATLTAYMIDDGSTDNCEMGSKSVSQSLFTCANLESPVTVTLTVEDATGNSATKTATITVLDTIKPVISASDLTASLNVDGLAYISTDDFEAVDNCGVAGKTVSKSEFNCEDKGENEVTLTAYDASGNTTTQTITVTVVDEIAPDVAEQDVTVYLDGDGSVSISGGDAIEADFDNCGITSRSLSQSEFTCADLSAPVSVTLSVKDASGNETIKGVVVTVLDTISPVALPQNITVELDENGEVSLSAADVATLIGSNSTDNCSISEASHSLSRMSFDCSNLGENEVVYTVQDQSSNSASAVVAIDVVDTSVPVAMAQDVILDLNADGEATLSSSDVENGSSDNCGIVSSSLSKSSFTCAEIGVHTVQYLVSDASGNSAQVDFSVTVRDQMAPTATLVQNRIIYLDASGVASLSVAEMVESSSDNCGVALETLNKTAFDCSEVGVNAVSVLIEDNYGNSTFIDGQVTVADTTKPALNINAINLVLNNEGTASLTEAMLQAYASDNCGIAEVAIQKQLFSCENLGVSSTEVLVYDINGNAHQQTLQVNLVDDMSPVVEVEAIEISLNHDGYAVLSSNMLNIRESDNCGVVSHTLSHTQFSCADLGTNIVELTVSDLAGNTAIANFRVTVVDKYAPQLIFPTSLEVCEGELEFISVTASDNCSSEVTQTAGPVSGSYVSAGSYELTYMAIDPSGNQATASITLVVHALPNVDLGDDIEIESGEILTFALENDSKATYVWSTGETTSSIQFAPDKSGKVWVKVTSAFGCESYDEVIVTVLNTTGINDVEDDKSITVYPNPATNQVSIAINGTEALQGVSVSIIDLNGKVVFQQNQLTIASGQDASINISDLSQGIYIVNIQSDKINTNSRFVKQ